MGAVKYTRVFMDAIKYVLPPVVVSSEELEARLQPLYEKLHIAMGQLEALTGVSERRWWEEENDSVSKGGAAAARRALDATCVKPEDLGAVVYTGVCREHFEPATACSIAAAIGAGPDAAVYDISNACLGVLNGILDVANRIELGQIRAGLVVSCETARNINETMIERMLEEKNMENFKLSLATLTGGSGAVAVVLTDGSFSDKTHQLLGGSSCAAPEHHKLCRWGLEGLGAGVLRPFMSTDSVSVLKYGVELGLRTWKSFLKTVEWTKDRVDKVVCHQVGAEHRNTILRILGIPDGKDYATYPYLGNIGTVSLPLTAAMASERNFIKKGDHVGFLGIGSGLNCTMLGFIW